MMRLLKVTADNSLELLTYSGEITEPYAILSHRWGEDEEEVHYNDVYNAGSDIHNVGSREAGRGFMHKTGYKKISLALDQARRDGLRYLWVDTCCIDKSSSAELSEAINSMYYWYKNAFVCYAYLADIGSLEEICFFSQSEWFTRGWTLQELIAPRNLVFYTRYWDKIGTKDELSEELSKLTGIEERILDGKKSVNEASVAQRMSWASQRKTKRVEDIAYCLLGVFSVNMPLLYGEKEKAFMRLQEEIAKEHPDDQTLFTWVDREAKDEEDQGMLARSPICFADSGSFVPCHDSEAREPFSFASRRLKLEVRLLTDHTAILGCRDLRIHGLLGKLVTVKLERTSDLKNEFRRIYCSQIGSRRCQGTLSSIYVPQFKASPALHDMPPVMPRYLLLFRRLQTPGIKAKLLEYSARHYVSLEERKEILNGFPEAAGFQGHLTGANVTPFFIGTLHGWKSLAVALLFSIRGNLANSAPRSIAILVGMTAHGKVGHQVIKDPWTIDFSTLEKSFDPTTYEMELRLCDRVGDDFRCRVVCASEHVNEEKHSMDMPCIWVSIKMERLESTFASSKKYHPHTKSPRGLQL